MRAWITAIFSFCGMNSYSLLNLFNCADLETSSKAVKWCSSYETHLLEKDGKQFVNLNEKHYVWTDDSVSIDPLAVATSLKPKEIWICIIIMPSVFCESPLFRQKIKGKDRRDLILQTTLTQIWLEQDWGSLWMTFPSHVDSCKEHMFV